MEKMLMMKNGKSRLEIYGVMLALVLAALCGGCASSKGNSPKPPNGDAFKLVFIADKSLAALGTVEVDLVPAFTEDEKNMLVGMSLKDYFNDLNGSRTNKRNKKAYKVAAEKPPEPILQKDTIWKTEWTLQGTKAKYLVVLANLRGGFSEGRDPQDPRRFIIPLDKKTWDAKALSIEIFSERVNVRPGK